MPIEKELYDENLKTVKEEVALIEKEF